MPKDGFFRKYDDGVFTEIADVEGVPYPSVKEMRASQRQGGTGRGLPENCVDELNEAQGHQVKIES